MRKGLLIGVLAVVAMTTATSSFSATCTAAQKAARVSAANAYAKKVPSERKAYFRTHKAAAQRKAFVAKQQKKLASLRSAASCETPPPAPPPTPPSTLTIYPDVPGDRADAARTGYQIGLQFLPKIGAPATWHADVVVAYGVDEIIAEVARTGSNTDFVRQVMADGGGGFAGPGHAYILPAGRSYDSMPYIRRVSEIVHEMFHTVQYAVQGAPKDPGPTWLREGAAEYVAYAAVVDAGLDGSSIRRDTIWAAQHDFASTPLSDSTSGGAAYNVGFVAVERLAALKGIGSLVAYWTEVGKGTAWQTAFAQVFGVSAAQFYSDFASYRQTV